MIGSRTAAEYLGLNYKLFMSYVAKGTAPSGTKLNGAGPTSPRVFAIEELDAYAEAKNITVNRDALNH